jgi:hypothetical protein
VQPHLLSFCLWSFVFIVFLLQFSSTTVPLSPYSFAPPRRRPLAVFHPQPACRSWFFDESHIQSFSSQICCPPLLQSIDAPHHFVIQSPSFPRLPLSFCSSHHAPLRDPLVPIRDSHMPTCVLLASIRSSTASLPSSYPLMNLLLSELFSIIFIFYVFLFCLCFVALSIICCFCVWWVLVLLLFLVLISDYDSASLASTSYRWLLLFLSEGRLVWPIERTGLLA